MADLIRPPDASDLMGPIRLGPNQPADRFYRGGEQIAAFRGLADSAPFTPEDWVASTTSIFGEPPAGLTRLPSGWLLTDELAADPVRWLGPEHVARRGADPGLLVKLLDAGERLPVHVHPHRDFAAQHLGLAHGKAEAWVLLRPAVVHLGWRRDVAADELAYWVERQDAEAMLAATHQLSVAAGATVYVPPGCPHAIGAGALLVELQEPTDLSILLEWRDFALDGTKAGHLGLGFDVALQAVDRAALSSARLAELRRPADAEPPLPPEADSYFRLERLRLSPNGPGEARLDQGYSVLVVVSGSARLEPVSGSWAPLDVTAGDTVLTPHATGDMMARGDGVLLRCRPPALPGEESRVGQRAGSMPEVVW